MDDHVLRYWIAFNRVNGIGAVRFHALLNYFQNDAEAAWRVSESALMEALGDRRAVAELLKARSTADLDADLNAVAKVGARAITLADSEYPPLLRQIANPPPLLYVKGDLLETDQRALSVIGTRDATEYGLRAVRQLTQGLADGGWTIVSGLAKGIDGVAHSTALRAGARTLALLGHGIDRVYPPEHKVLAEQITRQGALITEFPIGTPPDGKNFPQRNRLISGIARGVLVVEASLSSGALSTAKFALDQGREVFAVPGSIFGPESQGTNKLIQDGQAKLVLQVGDILTEFGETAPRPVKISPALESGRRRPPRVVPPARQEQPDPLASEPELEAPLRAIWNAIRAAPISADELSMTCDLPIAQVTTGLTMLEMRGLIRLSGGLIYALTEAD